ncbi:MAG: acylneuraminate cytidylyltransferase family protein [Oscillospiraceae bacterium]|nr:acylneuraminate cytidylyltransferase family protein [Oscillospiraceae bacterium]
MKNIAIIPARSGSKGLPDKNIRLVNGKPLLAYTIEAALESGCFDTVHVSTDSERYAEIAREFGADVPFLRSPELATDTASTWDVVREVLARYAELGRQFDTMMLMQPTTPLRTGEDVKAAYALLQEKQAKSVIAVCEVDHSPLWCDTIPDSGSMKGFGRKDLAWVNRQDLRPYYRVNGAIYLLSVDGIAISPDDDIYEDNCYALFMDRKKSVDIDSEDDLALVEFLLARRNRG